VGGKDLWRGMDVSPHKFQCPAQTDKQGVFQNYGSGAVRLCVPFGFLGGLVGWVFVDHNIGLLRSFHSPPSGSYQRST
jgi:hypothetical protein